MPAVQSVPTKIAGDVFTATMWNTYIRDNVNKLGILMHRQITVAAFLALTGLEDGDEAYVEVDATNGINWHLRYDLASTKWRFLGGAPLRADVATDESNASAAFGDLTTVGPSVTTPLLGDYDITIGANEYCASNFPFIGLKVGAAATADIDSTCINTALTVTPGGAGFRTMRKTAVPVSTVLKVQYRNAGAVTTHFLQRCLFITPARIG